jgi:hypothetical protein
MAQIAEAKFYHIGTALSIGGAGHKDAARSQTTRSHFPYGQPFPL